ncbi:MAG TPA: hypothetical protein VH678_29775 [Xanthobacteraceae bacterium]|jgi:hypothetical protein
MSFSCRFVRTAFQVAIGFLQQSSGPKQRALAYYAIIVPATVCVVIGRDAAHCRSENGAVERKRPSLTYEDDIVDRFFGVNGISVDFCNGLPPVLFPCFQNGNIF